MTRTYFEIPSSVWFWLYSIETNSSACVRVKSFQSSPTLCNPVGCSLSGSSAHGYSPDKNTKVGYHIFFSRGSSQPRDRTCVSYLLHWWPDSLPLAPPPAPCYLQSYSLPSSQTQKLHFFPLSKFPCPTDCLHSSWNRNLHTEKVMMDHQQSASISGLLMDLWIDWK